MTVDPAEFRTVMGHFATGVTVITTAADGELQGMTANAISSLSLEPVMVLVCIDKQSYTHSVIDAGRCFAVNILKDGQEAVSRVFARKGEPERGALRGQPYRIGATGAPVLKDCLAYMECRVTGMLDGGDHSIFLGEVVDEGVTGDGKPLLFYRGGYHSIGD